MASISNPLNFDPFKDIRAIIEDIRINFLYMTKEVLMKTNRFINKQIIDSIKNYFFENQIGTLLKPKMEKDSLKKVKSEIEDNIKCDPDNKYQDPDIPKYMIFMNAYIDQIEKYSLHQDYQNFLYDLILSDNQCSGFSDDWMTQMRKKITAVLLLGHFNSPNRQNLKNIFDLWANIYPNEQLNKVKKNFKNSKQSANNQQQSENQNNVSASSDSDGNDSEEEQEEEEIIASPIKVKPKRISKSKQTVDLKPKHRKQSLINQMEKDLIKSSTELKQNNQSIKANNREPLSQKSEVPLINENNKVQQKRQRCSRKQKDNQNPQIQHPPNSTNKEQDKMEEQIMLKPVQESIKITKKRGRKSSQNQLLQNLNDNDETSYSPLMQGPQPETYVAETQFILDHEEEEDDGEETNPQSYNRHMNIIPIRQKKDQQNSCKKQTGKRISKPNKGQKVAKIKQKKIENEEPNEVNSILDPINQMNSFNFLIDERTTSLSLYKTKVQQEFEELQMYQYTNINDTQHIQSIQNSPDKKINHENQNLMDDLNTYSNSNNYSIIPSQNNCQNSSQYYNNCFNYQESQQMANIQQKQQYQQPPPPQIQTNQTNYFTQHFNQHQQQQQLHQISFKNNQQPNSLLYNKQPSSYQYNQSQQLTTNSTTTAPSFPYATDITSNNTDYDHQFVNHHYPSYSNQIYNPFKQNSSLSQQYSQHQQQQQQYYPSHNEMFNKEDSYEQKIQNFSPNHYSDLETIQHKHSQDNQNQEVFQDYLNFDQENLSPNFCFSQYEILSHENHDIFYKMQHDGEYSQDAQLEIKKNSSSQIHKHLQQQEECQNNINIQINNQMSLETHPNQTDKMEDSQINIQVHKQREDITKREQRWRALSLRVEDKTEITITQEQQSEDSEVSASIKSISDDIYKENISVEDQEDDQLTQSF